MPSKLMIDNLSVLGVVLCFGGGVLLSTVFVHMLREVRESVDRAQALGMFSKEMEFPLAELLIGLGKTQISLDESSTNRVNP